METARLESHYRIATLSWNNDGNRLLTAGEQIQLWGNESADRVTFEVGAPAPSSTAQQPPTGWSCLWKTRPANPVSYLAFSPDGTLFATAGKNDRLVRLWYQNQQRECNTTLIYIQLA